MGGMTSPRIWLITGTTSGFGRALAEAVLDRGDTVVAGVRRPAALGDLADRVTPVTLDVTDPAAISRAVADVLLWHGRIDVLVNNAGRGHVGAVEETTDAELRGLMDLHFFGPAALTRAVLPHMREQGSGAIVQMSSMGGRLSFPGVGGYSATKFALEGLTEALHDEVARFGIRTLVVEPGAFRTGFNRSGALTHSEAIAAYDDAIQPVRDDLANGDGNQPGDPGKAAAAILAALDADAPPRRLVLGSDAADAVGASLAAQQEELTEWEATSRGTDVAVPA